MALNKTVILRDVVAGVTLVESVTAVAAAIAPSINVPAVDQGYISLATAGAALVGTAATQALGGVSVVTVIENLITGISGLFKKKPAPAPAADKPAA